MSPPPPTTPTPQVDLLLAAAALATDHTLQEGAGGLELLDADGAVVAAGPPGAIWAFLNANHPAVAQQATASVPHIQRIRDLETMASTVATPAEQAAAVVRINSRVQNGA